MRVCAYVFVCVFLYAWMSIICVRARHREMNRLHVALNDAIRKIFSFSRWESVKTLRESFGFQSVTEIFAKRKRMFLQKIPSTGNPLLSNLLNLE